MIPILGDKSYTRLIARRSAVRERTRKNKLGRSARLFHNSYLIDSPEFQGLARSCRFNSESDLSRKEYAFNFYTVYRSDGFSNAQTCLSCRYCESYLPSLLFRSLKRIFSLDIYEAIYYITTGIWQQDLFESVQLLYVAERKRINA